MIVLRKIALILLILFIFVVPTEKIVLIPGLGSLARVVGASAMLIWILSISLGERFHTIKPFHTIFFIFILWNAASFFWSADIAATLERIITWVQLGLLVVLIWDLLDNKTLTDYGMQAYVLGAMSGACGIIYNFLGSTEFVYGRYSAAGQHSVNIGLILALGIPLAWYLILQNTQNSTVARSLRLLNAMYIPIACIGIALTGSRGAMVASLPAILFIIPTLRTLPLWAKLFSALIAAGGVYAGYLLVPKASLERLGTAYTELTGGGNLTGRTQIWKDAYSHFLDNPILGVGSNAYKAVSEYGLVAHNSFLSVLVETGIIGFLLFLTLLAIALISCFHLPRLESRLWRTTLLIWFLGASALTFEHYKSTWLVLALIVGSRYQYTTLGTQESTMHLRPIKLDSKLKIPL